MRNLNALIGVSVVLATFASGACGSLDNGAINIVDANGGTGTGTGGTRASGGNGGSKSGSGGSVTNGGEAGAGADAGGQAGAGGETIVGGAPAGGQGGAAGSAGEAGAGGEAGATGGCSKSSDCAGTTPICDATMQCRACTAATECASAYPTKPYCRAGGCVGCLTDANCPAATPVCGAGNTCRICSAGSECSSLACSVAGQCATATQVVYALAQTGVYANECGTVDRPCGSLATAASKLTSARPYLVLVATQSAFNDGATLPANTNVSVFGNHVRVAPYDGSSAFVINGGNVVFDDVVAASTAGSVSGPSAAIACTGAKLKVFKGSVSNANTSYGAAGLQLTACDADVQQATFTGSQTGIASSCPNCAGGSTQTLTVERSLFQGNRDAIHFDGASYLIRNNLFLRNGNTSYVDIIGLRATSGILAFNTMVGNENNCSYEGGLVSCEGGSAACGTFSSNLSWNNMLNPLDPTQPCADQVYYSPPALTNSLSETTWPGTGNVSGDPRFVNASADNYTPGPGSPALNKGSTVAGIVPTVDYYGNPRGSAPDIGAIEAQ